MNSAPESIDKYLVTHLVEQVEANRALVKGLTARITMLEGACDTALSLVSATELACKLRLAEKDSCIASLKAANAELVDGLEDAYEAGVSDGKAEVYEGLLRLLEGAYKASDT